MITLGLLALGVIGVGVLAAFWKDIVGWINRIVEKITPKIQGTLQGVRIFFQKLQEGTKEMSKNYAKVGTKWQETIVQRTVTMDEIPEEYRSRLKLDQEEDFTEDLKLQLQH